MKKKKYLLILSVIIFVFFGCKKKDQKSISNFKSETLYISSKENIPEILQEHNYGNPYFINKILGKKILNNNRNFIITIKSTIDSLKIINLKLKSDDIVYNITKSDNDSISYKVKATKLILKGNNIFQILTDFGMKAKDIGYYAWKMGEYIDARSIKIGDTLSVKYNLLKNGEKIFTKLIYIPDKITIHEFTILKDRNLKYTKIILPYVIKKRFIQGEITKQNPTLDEAMKNLGIIPYIRQQANNAMQSQISFQTDARIGDKFELLIEELYVHNKQQQGGKVYYVKYSGKLVGTKYAYRFIDTNEASAFSGMYNQFGRRLISNAVRTPLNNMHITSPFGYRIHPLLGKRKFHKGIDLRGRLGTNVYAVSSGIVIKARNSGNGYGKEIRIRHSNGMITQYAHLSKIFVRYGKRVRKGQLIGKVGSTGLSTGPHLHFGVMKNGRWVNPVTNLKMIGATKLKGKKLKLFKKQILNYQNMIAKLHLQKTIIDTIFQNTKQQSL